ncbi:MAG TPA: STAS-like domain-containing protein [Candidatus Omnitrophota bacterium]|nr:STAS-like domain-containing protein [Candidatus Omnitrophota bacterium]
MRIFKMKEMYKGEKCISGKATGSFFRNEVEIALAKGPVIIDFDGIEAITQSFSDEFLGPILAHEGQDVLRTLKFKSCSEEIQAVILSTAHRFLSDTKAVS